MENLIKKADISLYGIDDELKNNSSSIYTTKLNSSQYQTITYDTTNYITSHGYEVFTYTGAIQTFKVPSGTTSVNVYCWGAGGASGLNTRTEAIDGRGGSGGFIKATLTIPSGTTSFKVIVGQGGRKGNDGTAFGGGGVGSSDGTLWIMGGGGGLSGIFVDNANMTMTGNNINNLATAIIIAGAGGGGGAQELNNTDYNNGGNGGSSTGNNGSGGTAGTGGSQLTGGTTGGALFTGGSASGAYQAGGGGGYYGGGRSSAGAGLVGGGGGGSSYLNTTNYTITNITNLKNTTNGTITAPGDTESYYQSGIAIGGISNGKTAGTNNKDGGNGLVVIEYLINNTSINSNLLNGGIFNYNTNYNLHYLNNSNYSIKYTEGKIEVGTLPTKPSTDYINLFKNPIAWYKFDTSTALLINDSSGSYTLTNNGATFNNTIYRKGDGSAFFNGGQYMTNRSFYDLNGISWSMSFWCYSTINTYGTFNILGSIGEILSGSITDYNYFQIGNFDGRWSVGAVYDASYPQIQEQNTWVHLVYTFNSVGTNKQEKLYRNGNLYHSVSTKTANWNFPNQVIEIGRRTLTDSRSFWTGYVDDFRFYNYELTAEEANVLYNNRYIDNSYPLLKEFFSRQYPPKQYNSMTSEINTTLNGQACKRKDLILNTTGITYGSGTYELYYISNSDEYLHGPFKLFDYDTTLTGAGGHFGSSFSSGFYGTNGNDAYSGTNYLVSSSYKGEWCVIKMPIPIILSSYKIIQRTSFATVSPKDFILYGSMDGINWAIIEIVVGASYSNQIFTSYLSTNTSYFTYYGIVVNKLIGGGGTSGVINFTEWQLFGRENNNEIITINPFVWYKFDDRTNLGLDTTTTHNLTNPNGAIFSIDITKGIGSVSFDGINDYLVKDGSFNLNSKSWSVSVWVKKTNNSRDDWIFEVGTGYTANTTLACGYRPGNTIVLSNYSDDLDTTNTYNDAGTWIHLCFTFLTGRKTATIYRNGVQVGQKNFANEYNTNNNFRIGKLSTAYFQGLLDDFRLYQDKVLTPTEVNELYLGRVDILSTNTLKPYYTNNNPYLLLDKTIDGVNYLITTKPSSFIKNNTKKYLFTLTSSIRQLKLSDKAKLIIKSIFIPNVISKSYLQSKAINNVIVKMKEINRNNYLFNSLGNNGSPVIFTSPLKLNTQGFGTTYSFASLPDKNSQAQQSRNLNSDNNGYLFLNPSQDYLFVYDINQDFIENGSIELEVIYDITTVFQNYNETNTYNYIYESLDYTTDRDCLEGLNVNFIIKDVDDSNEMVYEEKSLLNQINNLLLEY